MLETREKILVVLGFAVFCLGLAGYYVWRGRPAVRAVRVAAASEDLTRCRFVADLKTKIGPSNRFEAGQSHNAQLLDAEQRLRQQAAAAEANTIVFAADALMLTAKAFRCDTATP